MAERSARASAGRGWTDLNESDPGLALVEVLSYVADLLAWYADQVASEARLRAHQRYALSIGTILLLVGWCRRRRRSTHDEAQ